jgi:hypothetical protein
MFERKLCRRILGPIHDNEKENWGILTNKEIHAIVKNPNVTETIMLHGLRWFGHVQGGWKKSWWRIVAGKYIHVYQREMEEAPENGKESSHTAHPNEMNE